MILGVDEVGRGSLAGPLVVGVVGLERSIEGLNDSKLIKSAKRIIIAQEIYKKAVYYSLGWVFPEEIDLYGLTISTTLAIKRALLNKPTNYDLIIIDGNYNYLPNEPKSKCMIKADQTIPAVSAASIIAKVERDNYMHQVDQYFASYDFKHNVGYGTKIHLLALRGKGPSGIHRMSFLRNYFKY
jgi:ribonuclease HII